MPFVSIAAKLVQFGRFLAWGVFRGLCPIVEGRLRVGNQIEQQGVFDGLKRGLLSNLACSLR